MKRTCTLTFCAAFLILTLTQCSKNYYITSNFDEKTSDHHRIAILPVEMVFTGKQPENLTDEDIAAIEEGESQAFQIALYEEILESTRGGKKPFRVDVQSFSKTNSILEDRGYSVRDSWYAEPEELADMLGVDAVVTMRIEKKRYMSDLASYGVETAVRVVNILTEGALGAFIPGGLDKTSDIRANCMLLDGDDGITLWSKAIQSETDWDSPAELIIQNICHRMGHDFPYRISKKDMR